MEVTEQQEKINHKKRVFLLCLILSISSVSLFYAYEQNFWQETKQHIMSIHQDGYSNYSQYLIVRAVSPSNYKEEIKHTIIAEIVQIQDSDKREITTFTGEKYVLDNYTLPMKLQQIVKIYEINNYPQFCNITSVEWENGTIVNGEESQKLVESGKHSYEWGYWDNLSGKLIDPKCDNSTSYYELGN